MFQRDLVALLVLGIASVPTALAGAKGNPDPKGATTTATVATAPRTNDASTGQKPTGPGLGRTVPFQSVPQEFPPDFQGNDLKAVIRALQEQASELGIVKDEFTSTAEFARRAEGAVQRLNERGKYIFILSGLSRVMSQYDADSQNLAVKVDFSHMTDDYKSSLSGIALSSDRTNLGSYTASNAFGASVEVKKSESVDYVLGFTDETVNTAVLATRNKFFEFEIVVPMQSGEARAAKDNIAVVILASLAHPPLMQYQHYTTPEIDFPYDSKTSNQILYTNLEKLIVINKKTGKVYVSL